MSGAEGDYVASGDKGRKVLDELAIRGVVRGVAPGELEMLLVNVKAYSDRDIKMNFNT